MRAAIGRARGRETANVGMRPRGIAAVAAGDDGEADDAAHDEGTAEAA